MSYYNFLPNCSSHLMLLWSVSFSCDPGPEFSVKGERKKYFGYKEKINFFIHLANSKAGSYLQDMQTLAVDNLIFLV